MMMLNWRNSIIALICILLQFSVPASAQENRFRQDQVNAVFAFNVARFTTWPESAFESGNSPINFCTLGETPVLKILSQVVENETLHSRKVKTAQLQNLDKVNQCQVLYITETATRVYSDQLKALTALPILQISELPGFASSGGMLTLLQSGGRIKPVINIDSVNRSTIKISSKLLRLATIVNRRE